MPLWKIYHPVGAFTAEDKHAFAQTITDLYAKLPLPKFYVCQCHFPGNSEGLLLYRRRAGRQFHSIEH